MIASWEERTRRVKQHAGASGSGKMAAAEGRGQRALTNCAANCCHRHKDVNTQHQEAAQDL